MTRLLLSLAAGAGAALLFAPKSGSELREDIVNRSRDMKDSLLEKGRELISQVGGTESHSSTSSSSTTSGTV